MKINVFVHLALNCVSFYPFNIIEFLNFGHDFPSAFTIPLFINYITYTWAGK